MSSVKAIIVGSPGFYKDDFFEQLKAEAASSRSKVLEAVV
jgi:stalled ribosome rescue protein Dom34